MPDRPESVEPDAPPPDVSLKRSSDLSGSNTRPQSRRPPMEEPMIPLPTEKRAPRGALPRALLSGPRSLAGAAVLGAALLAGFLPGSLSAQRAPAAASPADTAAVSAVLSDFHDAASRADGDGYFGLFAEDAIFLGTDAGERWTLEEFRAYARPYFERGQGWTYVPTERHVHLSSDGATAWFDELLENEGLGVTRGTGVLVREDGAWKVAQYHLAIPIPNEIAGEVVEMVREAGGA